MQRGTLRETEDALKKGLLLFSLLVSAATCGAGVQAHHRLKRRRRAALPVDVLRAQMRSCGRSRIAPLAMRTVAPADAVVLHPLAAGNRRFSRRRPLVSQGPASRPAEVEKGRAARSGDQIRNGDRLRVAIPHIEHAGVAAMRDSAVRARSRHARRLLGNEGNAFEPAARSLILRADSCAVHARHFTRR